MLDYTSIFITIGQVGIPSSESRFAPEILGRMHIVVRAKILPGTKTLALDHSFIRQVYLCYTLWKLWLKAFACQRHIECSRHPGNIKLFSPRTGHALAVSTYVHVVEALVDSLQSPGVGDELIYPKGSVHVVWKGHVRSCEHHIQIAGKLTLNDTGQLCSTLDTAECRTLPHSTSDKLESAKNDLVIFSTTRMQGTYGLVLISAPAGATPIMVETPQPL